MRVQCFDRHHDKVRAAGWRITHIDHCITKSGKDTAADGRKKSVTLINREQRCDHVHDYGSNNDRPDWIQEKSAAQKPKTTDGDRDVKNQGNSTDRQSKQLVKDQGDSVYPYHRKFCGGSKIIDTDSDQDSSDNVSCDIFCKFQSFVLIHDNNLLDVDGMWFIKSKGLPERPKKTPANYIWI